MRIVTKAATGALLLGAGVLAAGASTASTQTLSQGDYEQCAVYNRDGEFAGYDSVCLERKRAALRRLQSREQTYYQQAPAQSGIYCPQWANLGAGYVSTRRSDGSLPPVSMAYDAPVNGNPCVPNQVIITTGLS